MDATTKKTKKLCSQHPCGINSPSPHLNKVILATALEILVGRDRLSCEVVAELESDEFFSDHE